MEIQDTAFLKALDLSHDKTIHIRLIALDNEDCPCDEITGRAIEGSVNIDGKSAVRRTCSLSLITDDSNQPINDVHWSFTNKFKLEIGVNNSINPNYPNIIWFKQGIFIINSFSKSINTNSMTISISGQDKMCRLNGTINGSMPHEINLAVEDFVELDGSVTTKRIPIYTIIKEGVMQYGQERPENIIINDLDETAYELWEYRGENPMYLIYNADKKEFVQMTFSQDVKLTEVESGNSYIINNIPKYYSMNTLDKDYNNNATVVKYGDLNCYVVKIVYGETAGYHKISLTYNDDLILKTGEAFTSALDKLVQMLGEFEYFYDLDGKFVFQKKNTYMQELFSPVDGEIIHPSMTVSPYHYIFDNSELFTSKSESPRVADVKNDYVIWGTKKGVSGDLPIHARYAIDKKPTWYRSLEWINSIGQKNVSRLYYTAESEKQEEDGLLADWRELIYRMAIDFYQLNQEDDFLYRVQENNPWAIDGKTGYEQYYSDIQGFWRQLYDPSNPVSGVYQADAAHDIDNLCVRGCEIISEDHFNKTIQQFDIFTFGGIVVKKGNQLVDIEGNALVDLKDKVLYDSIEYNSLIRTNVYEEGKRYFIIDDKYSSFMILPNDIKEDGRKSIEKEVIIDNQLITGDGTKITLYVPQYNYYPQLKENESDSYWNKNIHIDPNTLLFWFDFLDTEGEIGKYSVNKIGQRSKVVNETAVNSIYYKETPEILFIVQPTETSETHMNYSLVYIQDNMQQLFTRAVQGMSAISKANNLIYNYTCTAESMSLNCIPIYYLQPNTRIKVEEYGDFTLDKISIPLAYNGTMSLNCTKIFEQFY